MAARKKKGAVDPAKFAPPADPDVWPDIDVLSDDQIARAKRCWDAYDATQVGEVAAVDLGGMLRAMGFTPTQAQVTAVVEAKAVDKRLDYVAWLEIVCKFTDGLSDLDTLARKFAVFDQAGSGFITHGQFRTIFGSLGSEPMSLEDVEEFLLEADPGKTGRVEYRPWLEKFLAEAQQPIPDINAK